MPRALIYCRISSDPTGRAAGVQRQETECRDLADQLGWDILEVLVDNDISAYGGKRRPAYEKLIDALRTGRADSIIAWHTDRLYRRSRDLTELIDIANEHKIAIRTVTSGDIDLSTASGRMMARVVAAVGEHEVEHGQERMRLARAQAAGQGRWVGGQRPFGYEPDGVTVRESEAREVAAATRRVLLGGTLTAIATEWNARGILTSQGKLWSTTTVGRLLLRARNAGLIEFRGELIEAKAQWPAIVPEHEWRAARDKLTDPKRRTAFTTARKYLGSGLYLCSLCDDGTTVHAHNPTGPTRRRSYRCFKPGRHSLVRNAEPIDRYVLRTVSNIIRAKFDSGELRVMPPGDEDLSALYAEASSIRVQLDAARRALADNQLDLPAYTMASKQWQADLEAVEARLERHGEREPLMALMDSPDPAGEFLSDRMSMELRRAIIGRLVTVTLLPGKPGRLPGGKYFNPVSVVIEARV